MIDTDMLAEGEWVTVIPEVQSEPRCPVCNTEKAEWDCAGCGYEWTAGDGGA